MIDGSMNLFESFLLKFKLSNSQLKIIRDIFLEIGLVFFAGWAIGPLVGQEFQLCLLLLGLIFSMSLWYTCLKITSYLEKNE